MNIRNVTRFQSTSAKHQAAFHARRLRQAIAGLIRCGVRSLWPNGSQIACRMLRRISKAATLLEARLS